MVGIRRAGSARGGGGGQREMGTLLRYNYKCCKWNTIEARESTRNDRNNCFLAAAAAVESQTWLISTNLGTLQETTTLSSPNFSISLSHSFIQFNSLHSYTLVAKCFNNQKLWWIHFRFVYTPKCFSPLSLHHQYHISLSICLFLWLCMCLANMRHTQRISNQVHFKNSIMVSSHFIPENYLKHFDDNFHSVYIIIPASQAHSLAHTRSLSLCPRLSFRLGKLRAMWSQLQWWEFFNSSALVQCNLYHSGRVRIQTQAQNALMTKATWKFSMHSRNISNWFRL